ncbi:hypothetical protein Tsubulata_047235 [Turnera subulata]|uniref:Uncharacterized protein n=1 Tax=Turnera subulata TaxID=218843 RepID=A0A9Q0G9J8_9ROSI|nr:hypothetical protein Tsubulata_047235 [Turnera subulata]
MSKIVYPVQSFGLADSREDIGGKQSAADNSQPAVILPTQTLQSTNPRLTTRGQPPKAQVTSAPSITLAPHEIPVTFDVSLDGTTAAASKQRTKKGRKVGTSSRSKPQEHSQVSASSSQPKSQSLAPAMSDAPNLSKTITWKRRGREKAREQSAQTVHLALSKRKMDLMDIDVEQIETDGDSAADWLQEINEKHGVEVLGQADMVDFEAIVKDPSRYVVVSLISLLCNVEEQEEEEEKRGERESDCYKNGFVSLYGEPMTGMATKILAYRTK